MFKRLSSGILLTAASLAFLTLVGCGGGGGGSRPPTEADYYGTWIEIRGDDARNQRMAPVEPKTPNLRQITFNNDKTFKMVMVTPAGAPVTPAEEVTGTWSLNDRIVIITTQGNTLNAKYKDWELTDALTQTLSGPGGEERRLQASCKDGSAAIFKFKN